MWAGTPRLVTTWQTQITSFQTRKLTCIPARRPHCRIPQSIQAEIRPKLCDFSSNSGAWRKVDSATTGTNGVYQFNGLAQGYYYVEVEGATLPGGAVQNLEAALAANGTGGAANIGADGSSNYLWGSADTTPTDNNLSTYAKVDFAAPATTDIYSVNYGYTINPMIYGTVWQDMDGSGTRQSGDNGIQATSLVQLRDCGVDGSCAEPGGTISLATTGTDGAYSFKTGLTAGHTYEITVVTAALPNAGTTTWTETAESDSSINQSIVVTLLAGEIDGSHDFGFTQKSTLSIGDKVYYDWNENGVQDAGENEGIHGLTMSLYEDVNGDGLITSGVDALISTTVTNATGAYLFKNNVGSKSYLVLLDEGALPAGTFQTGDPDEVNVCVSCDGRAKVTLAGVDYLNADFGYHPQGVYTFGDTVWKDVNGDGIQSGPQESGLAGITVWLEADLNGDGIWTRAFTTMTDSTGGYLFAVCQRAITGL